MAHEMTAAEHRRQKELLLAAMLLADTRSDRHEVDRKRQRRTRRSAWSMPSVNERKA